MKPSINWIKNGLIGCLTLIATSGWASGGVGDGGGGTTTPKVVTPPEIASIIEGQMNRHMPILRAWWNGLEDDYYSKKANSSATLEPYLVKLFGNEKNVFSVLDQLTVELPMSAPCFDKHGVEKDGSILTRTVGGVCISPYRIAPKVTAANFEAETLALMVHEISHLLGTDEAEAVALQNRALQDFSKLDFHVAAGKISMLTGFYGVAGTVNEILNNLDLDIRYPDGFTLDAQHELARDLLDLRDKELKFPSILSPVQFLRSHSLEAITPEFIRIRVVSHYIELQDLNVSPEMKKYLQNYLDVGFGNDEKLSVETFLKRSDSPFYSPMNIYAEVQISRPRSLKGVARELGETRKILVSILEELTALSKFQPKVDKR